MVRQKLRSSPFFESICGKQQMRHIGIGGELFLEVAVKHGTYWRRSIRKVHLLGVDLRVMHSLVRITIDPSALRVEL